MPDYLTEKELATRWKLSCRTLQRWRRLGLGPPFLKLGGRVVYARTDLEAWERAHRRMRTASR